MKIDVTIATKNSDKTIEKCIECIKLHIPYNRIIVIDDSDDQTAEIAKRHGCEVYRKHALLGEIRFKQARAQKYILFHCMCVLLRKRC